MWGLVIKHLCKSPGQRCSPAWPVSWSNLAENQRTAGIPFFIWHQFRTFGLGDLGIRLHLHAEHLCTMGHCCFPPLGPGKDGSVHQNSTQSPMTQVHRQTVCGCGPLLCDSTMPTFVWEQMVIPLLITISLELCTHSQ